MARKSIPPKVVIKFEDGEATMEETVAACIKMIKLIATWDIPDSKYKNLIKEIKKLSF